MDLESSTASSTCGTSQAQGAGAGQITTMLDLNLDWRPLLRFALHSAHVTLLLCST
jgi:hypothetical protein